MYIHAKFLIRCMLTCILHILYNGQKYRHYIQQIYAYFDVFELLPCLQHNMLFNQCNKNLLLYRILFKLLKMFN